MYTAHALLADKSIVEVSDHSDRWLSPGQFRFSVIDGQGHVLSAGDDFYPRTVDPLATLLDFLAGYADYGDCIEKEFGLDVRFANWLRAHAAELTDLAVSE